MEELIVSIISLIILVPIIYFLPLGLSHKGKGLLILIAFVFANLGLMVKSSLPVWQAGGIILLLIVLTVYILDRKFSKLLYANGKTVEEDVKEDVQIENAPVESEKKLLTEDTPVNLDEDDLPVASDIALVAELEEEKISMEIHTPSETDEDQLFKDENNPTEEVFQVDELIEDTIEETVDIDSLPQEESGFLSKREEIAEDSDGTVVQEEELPAEGYMSEIEQLIEDAEVEEEHTEVSKTEETIEESLAEEISEVESVEFELVEDILIPETDDEPSVVEEQVELNEEFIAKQEEELPEESYMSEIEQLIEGVELEENQVVVTQTEVVESHTEELDEVEQEELELIDEKVSEASSVEEQDELTEESTYDSETDEVTEELIASELSEDVIPEFTFDDKELLIETITSENDVKHDVEQLSLEDDDNVLVDTEEQESALLNELNLAQSEAAVSLDLDTDEPVLEEEQELEASTIDEDLALDEEPTDAASEIEAVETTFEEVIPTKAETQKSVLQQQLFHTMVSQLHLARKHMKADEYEKYINDHLHPDLPAQDYYTFASLLIEHYISKKQLEKLQELLTDLRSKFTNYPILDMEIQFLYEQYCGKTR